MSEENSWYDEPDEELDDEGTETLPCPHCGAEIYEETERCPACGDYVTFSTNVWSGRPAWWIVLALTGLLAAVLVLAGLVR